MYHIHTQTGEPQTLLRRVQQTAQHIQQFTQRSRVLLHVQCVVKPDAAATATLSGTAATRTTARTAAATTHSIAAATEGATAAEIDAAPTTTAATSKPTAAATAAGAEPPAAATAATTTAEPAPGVVCLLTEKNLVSF